MSLAYNLTPQGEAFVNSPYFFLAWAVLSIFIYYLICKDRHSWVQISRAGVSKYVRQKYQWCMKCGKLEERK